MFVFFFLMIRRPPRSTLFPSTTLSRSHAADYTAVSPTAASRSTASVSRAARSQVKPAARSRPRAPSSPRRRSEEHTSELQSRQYLVCRLLLEKKHHIDYIVLERLRMLI